MLRVTAAVVLAILFAGTLATYANENRPPVLSWSIGTGVQSSYPFRCTGQKTVFDSTDGAVYVQVEVDGPIERTHMVIWQWFDPDGALFFTFTLPTESPKPGYHWNDYSIWANLNIRGTPAATKPGTWTVFARWGGHILRKQKFEIRSTGLPPLILGPSQRDSISVEFTNGVAYCDAHVCKASSTATTTRVRFEVDSGAGISMAPSSLADALGISLRSGDKYTLTDVSGTEIDAWAHWVDVTLLGDGNTALPPIRIRVAFADSESVPYLLGREDVLEQVEITLTSSGFTITLVE